MVSVSSVTSLSRILAAAQTRSRKRAFRLPNCRSTVKCKDDKKRQNVLCTGNRVTRKIPSNIGSRSRYCRWFNREKPTYTARIMASKKSLGFIALGIRFNSRLTEVPTSSRNSSFSSIAATGSSPPYAVRFLPVKLYFVAALILLGSRDCSPRACSAASALTWSKSVFTNWVAPFPAAPRRRPHGLPPFYPNIGRLAKATPTQTLSQFKPTGTRRVHNLGVT